MIRSHFFREVSKSLVLSSLVATLFSSAVADPIRFRVVSRDVNNLLYASEVSGVIDPTATKGYDEGKDIIPPPMPTPSPAVDHFQITSPESFPLSRAATNIPYFQGTIAYRGFTPSTSTINFSNLPAGQKWLLYSYSVNNLVHSFPVENGVNYTITGVDKYLLVAAPQITIERSATNPSSAFDLCVKFPAKVDGLTTIPLLFSPDLTVNNWFYLTNLTEESTGVYVKRNQPQIGNSGFFKPGL